MKPSQNPYLRMPDGTLKHINPLTGTEVWAVPGRASRPAFNRTFRPPKPLPPGDVENYCDFCRGSLFKTPPEKSRLVRTQEGFRKMDRVSPDLIEATIPFFRRIPNLFEIVTLDYWVKNHGFRLSPSQEHWKERYLGNARGAEHVQALVEAKLELTGIPRDEIEGMSQEEKFRLAEPFFGGAHELIVAGPHFKRGAEWDNEFFSSGEMTPEEHFHYVDFTLAALREIYGQNPHVRYVTVFQNWLQPAGASFDHLHRQLVGLDEWGSSIQAELDLAREDPSVYNRALVDFSRDENLVVAENDHAVALSELGHRYPTLAVYSKSPWTRPWELGPEELRGFSDLVQACHAAAGSQVPCNEEWYYPPPGAPPAMPWHILIKWRTVNPAGFEGGTKIFINPVSPSLLRDQVLPRLKALRKEGKIAAMRIGQECGKEKNSLRYGTGDQDRRSPTE